jgi:hydroxysqualene synthase
LLPQTLLKRGIQDDERSDLRVSVNHYENFPVASMLCPARVRPAVAAIYHFARTADDLADEGCAPSAQRLEALQAYRSDLQRVFAGAAPSGKWQWVFEPLQRATEQFAWPMALFGDLISAFEQDVVHDRDRLMYADRDALLAYCAGSANPIGRLMVHLVGLRPGVDRAQALRCSDAICSSLQLINFWQDLSLDLPRGRWYLPLSDLQQHGLTMDDLLKENRSNLVNPDHSAAIQALLGDLMAWTQQLMHEGQTLVHLLHGRMAWELRLVVQGGLRVLEKTSQNRHRALQHRPKLRALDAPLLLLRALMMRS